MRLIHWSEKPITSVCDTVQTSMNFKPDGLWVSDEDAEQSWSSWCESEMPHWINLPYVYEITLNPNANILFISTIEELDNFNDHYIIDSSKRQKIHFDAISWQILAQDYDGILITPYHLSRRYDLMWYASWDCASGCIWNAIAVSKLETLRPVNAPR